MARIQALTQQHAFEHSSAPISSRMMSGMSGVSEGVPKMHPLKSSGPIFKASSLLHIAKFKAPGLKKPRMGGMGMPRMGTPRL